MALITNIKSDGRGGEGEEDENIEMRVSSKSKRSCMNDRLIGI